MNERRYDMLRRHCSASHAAGYLLMGSRSGSRTAAERVMGGRKFRRKVDELGDLTISGKSNGEGAAAAQGLQGPEGVYTPAESWEVLEE